MDTPSVTPLSGERSWSRCFQVDTAAVATLTTSSGFCGSPRLSEEFPSLAYFYVEKTACSKEKTPDPRTSLVFLFEMVYYEYFWGTVALSLVSFRSSLA